MQPKHNPILVSLNDLEAEKIRRALNEIPIMATSAEVDLIRHRQETAKIHKGMNRHQRRRAMAKARRSK